MNNTLNAMYIIFITREYIRLVTSPSVLWKSPFLNCQLVSTKYPGPGLGGKQEQTYRDAPPGIS